jgi:hypothetical protein
MNKYKVKYLDSGNEVEDEVEAEYFEIAASDGKFAVVFYNNSEKSVHSFTHYISVKKQ